MQCASNNQTGGLEGKGVMYRGCLFCRSGFEKKVVKTLGQRYPTLRFIAPERMRIRREKGKVTNESVILLPGYVFFESEGPELSMNLAEQEYVLRLLTYPDGIWHLRDCDDAFASMLFQENGKIDFSKAEFDEGDRIHILGGFLMNYEGAITRVNRRYRSVEISIELYGKIISMWVGYELVEKTY